MKRLLITSLLATLPFIAFAQGNSPNAPGQQKGPGQSAKPYAPGQQDKSQPLFKDSGTPAGKGSHGRDKQ